MIATVERASSLDSLDNVKTTPTPSLQRSVTDIWKNDTVFKINQLVIAFIGKDFERMQENKRFPELVTALVTHSRTCTYPLELFKKIFKADYTDDQLLIATHLITHERRFLIEIIEKEFKKRDIPLPKATLDTVAIMEILAHFMDLNLEDLKQQLNVKQPT